MKKTGLLLLTLTIGAIAEEPYVLSSKINMNEITKKGRAVISQMGYQDWCINDQAWRQYYSTSKGSLSQIMYTKDAINSLPLTCKLYPEWKRQAELTP